MKEIKYTILYCVFVRTFVIPFAFFYGSGTAINNGSGSDFLTSYGSGSTRQKVTVPTVLVPVPHHWMEAKQRSNGSRNKAQMEVGTELIWKLEQSSDGRRNRAQAEGGKELR